LTFETFASAERHAKIRGNAIFCDLLTSNQCRREEKRREEKRREEKRREEKRK
jgi:hypothetical protein